MTAISLAPLFVVRPVAKDDWALIYSSWKKSHRGRRKERQRSAVPPVEYYHRMQRRIDACLAREGAEVIVACDADDPDFILGWACVEGDVLHYVYVRQAARGLGVARKLLAGRRVTRATHWTHCAREYDQKHPGAIALDEDLSKELDP